MTLFELLLHLPYLTIRYRPRMFALLVCVTLHTMSL